MAPAQNNQTPNDEADANDTMLARHGRQITRFFEMFWSPTDVIVLAKKLHRLNPDAELRYRESADASKQRLLFLVDKLNELQPGLAESLCQSSRHTQAAFRDAKTRFGIGQSNARSEDMRKVRLEMPKWSECGGWNLGEKSARGLYHRECAKALADSRVDVNDEAALTEFMTFGLPAMAPSFWGNFMWLDGVVDPINRASGLLRNGLLVKTGKCIALSPASSYATSGAVGARGRSSRHRGLIGIAKAYNITEVTPAFIAYVCVVTRHSLTSDEQFAEVCSGFNYVEFYNQVRGFLEKPQYERWSRELINWWNEQLFGGLQLGGVGEAGLDEAHGTLAMLDVELEVEGLDVGAGLG
ncbi:hypothetical protein FRC07_003498 [Ceratobasidium sp. 392]|nr:hypothetical protein FRC07_003498 [Ceratobasidium sp. 392]